MWFFSTIFRPLRSELARIRTKNWLQSNLNASWEIGTDVDKNLKTKLMEQSADPFLLSSLLYPMESVIQPSYSGNGITRRPVFFGATFQNNGAQLKLFIWLLNQARQTNQRQDLSDKLLLRPPVLKQQKDFASLI